MPVVRKVSLLKAYLPGANATVEASSAMVTPFMTIMGLTEPPFL